VTSILKALIIDDDRPIRALIANVLRDDGWDVEESPSAETAIDELQKGDWPLVFCDVVLGGPDGYSVLKHFKAAQPEGCFILMTGRGSAAGALEATAMGAYDYLLKPFSVADILRISSLIKNRWHLIKELSKVHVPL
jgi:DNA-binding NtrC family response regulator